MLEYPQLTGSMSISNDGMVHERKNENGWILFWRLLRPGEGNC